MLILELAWLSLICLRLWQDKVVAFRFSLRPRDNISDDKGDNISDDGSTSDDGSASDETDELLEIELHEWAKEARALLAQLLVASEVAHTWQGATLVTHESDEDQVDGLISIVQEAETHSPEVRELDPDQPQTAFEMEGWSADLQTQLSQRLSDAEIPHEFDADGDFVCQEDDELVVEAIIEELMARTTDEELETLDGLEVNKLLSSLFVATDRLRRDVRDPKGVLGALKHGQRVAEVATPFGFSASSWASIRQSASQLVDLIESDEATDHEIGEHASRLRNSLQQLV